MVNKIQRENDVQLNTTFGDGHCSSKSKEKEGAAADTQGKNEKKEETNAFLNKWLFECFIY